MLISFAVLTAVTGLNHAHDLPPAKEIPDQPVSEQFGNSLPVIRMKITGVFLNIGIFIHS